MKKKKSAVLSLSSPYWDTVMVTLFSVLLFFAMNLWSEPAAVGFAFIALVLVIGPTPWRLARERFCVPVIGFMGFMLMTGLAAIYSPFGGSAVRDFRGILPAFALAVVVLLRFEKRHVRGLLWGVAAVCAVISLLSTDMACEGKLYEVFTSLMGQFDMGEVYTNLENTVGRVNGLYNDSNVTGSLFAIASLIALYLVQTGEKWWARLFACVLISINAVGLLLSVSRGAILCFGLSLLVWLIAAGKEHRIRLFLLMVVSAGTCLAAFMPASEAIAPDAVLPNLLSVGAGAIIFLLDWGIAERLAQKLAGHGTAVAVAMGSLVFAVVVFVIAALNLTEPYVLKAGANFTRAVNLEPGDYTLSVDWESDAARTVYIYSRSDEETLLNHYTSLYYGPVEDAVFTVSEKGVRVFFRFWGDGDILNSVTLSNGIELPMRYKLLPEALVSRMWKGLRYDESFSLRVQYMKDAWKLFRESPVTGHGLGATDNLYPTVQPFYYTSRFVHNHLLQVMTDMGILGLVPFLVLLCGSLWLLLRALCREQDSLAAILVSCWVMVNTHSLMEINFSVQAYQCVAFALLVLPMVLYSTPLTVKAAVKLPSLSVCVILWLYLAVFGGLLGLRQSVRLEAEQLRASSLDELMSALDSFARRDVFDPAVYQLEYVATAAQNPGGAYDLKMLEYVERIRKSQNYPACSGLLEYYYLVVGDFQGLFECSQECLTQRTSYANVWNGQMAFYQDKVLPAVEETSIEVFTAGVLAFQEALEKVNHQDDRLEEISLTETNQAFVELTASAVAQGLSGEELYTYLVTGGVSAVA